MKLIRDLTVGLNGTYDIIRSRFLHFAANVLQLKQWKRRMRRVGDCFQPFVPYVSALSLTLAATKSFVLRSWSHAQINNNVVTSTGTIRLLRLHTAALFWANLIV